MRLWKYLPLLIVMILWVVNPALKGYAQNVQGAAVGTAITNADVIALVRAGMSDDIVAAKIQAAPATAFDTSVSGLTALKAADVSSVVIRAMISPHPTANSYIGAKSAGGVDLDDPTAPHSPGVYALYRSADGQVHLVKLEGTRPRGAKNSGLFLHALTQGITTSKTQQVIEGAKATIEFTETKPVFYAYIPDSGGSFAGGMSVKDLVLTKFEVKGDTRLWTYAARGLFGGSSEVGSNEKDRQGFSTEQIKPGIYRLTPEADLATGQYAFKYAFSYFDFGIQPGAKSQPVTPPQTSTKVPSQPQPPPAPVTGKAGDFSAGPGLPVLHTDRTPYDGCHWVPVVSKRYGFAILVMSCTGPGSENMPQYSADDPTFINSYLEDQRLQAANPKTYKAVAIRVFTKPAAQSLDAAVRQQILPTIKLRWRTSCHVKLSQGQQAGTGMQTYDFTSTMGPGLQAAKKADFSDALPCSPWEDNDSAANFYYKPSESKTIFFFSDTGQDAPNYDMDSIRFLRPDTTTQNPQ
ncbi:hypothetical protein [Granulicella aggregans]|uniref:hypothetical protein n=1 Tax=Granulicella aggregans TaxID=474949 RepID=UPI0021E036D9|nr:hypothetical protein [Granulicella aggregans]